LHARCLFFTSKEEIMLIVQNLSYIHPNKDLLFNNINLTISNQQKVALVGNNGIGKSTLFKIIAGVLQPWGGRVEIEAAPYYVLQIFGQFNELTIAQALNVEDKLRSFKEILAGHMSEANLTTLNDDWLIEERCNEALKYWKLEGLDLSEQMKTLSGGQKTRAFLAGIIIHQPELVLLDEPSNHLDAAGRQLLYHFIQSTKSTLIVVSHDRTLLNLLGTVYEMSRQGITVYGGNYYFYVEQKGIERNALAEDARSKEKALRKAKEIERETIERKQKLDARGRKLKEKSGVPTISMNTLRNNAEKSTSRLKDVHAEKISGISEELKELRKQLPDLDQMKFGFDHSSLHKGKVLINAKDINHGYDDNLLWNQNLSFQIRSGERIALNGLNGSGKTTLIKIMLGNIKPKIGTIASADNKWVYIDQDYSLIDNSMKVYEQAASFNSSGLQEHEIKVRLNRFLFTKDEWDKTCIALSGGEKMRLMLCCLTLSNQAPDIIVLDEPTNNLDIQNIEILTTAINEYQGTLIVVSHDQYFLKEIRVGRAIRLE
jgi:ATPase subunit of ABC transporter with duplicated ATPase domains